MHKQFIQSDINRTTLTLNIANFPGGVAIWGALPPVLNTHNDTIDRGVHVHARLKEAEKKCVDATFDKVFVTDNEKLFEIHENIAVMFSMASIFKHSIQSLICKNCNQYLLSTGLFALIPHYEHICLYCGNENISDAACVSNPIIRLKCQLGDGAIQRQTIQPKRTIYIEPGQYLGGIQVWGSNPSILWTAKRLEESAIHVHAYNAEQCRIVDNTYGEVYLNKKQLDIQMVRILQVQQQLAEIRCYLTCVRCPACNQAQFDQGIYAVLPRQHRVCSYCRLSFIHHAAISNPVIEIIDSFIKSTNYV